MRDVKISKKECYLLIDIAAGNFPKTFKPQVFDVLVNLEIKHLIIFRKTHIVLEDGKMSGTVFMTDLGLEYLRLLNKPSDSDENEDSNEDAELQEEDESIESSYSEDDAYSGEFK